MRPSKLAALPLLLAAARDSRLYGLEAPPVEIENRRLARQLDRRRDEFQELVRLARAQGGERNGLEVDALSWMPGRPRSLAEEGEAGEHGAEAGAHEHGAHKHGTESEAEEAEGKGEPEEEEEEEAEGGERESEEEEEEEEELVFEPWDMDTSVMLLGMISFVMILFYLTNWPDDDIRLYSWQITSATISIFCAVLLFTGFNELIRHTFETKDNAMVMCLLHFVHCFIYLALMHIGTAVESGVMCEVPGGEAAVAQEKWVYADALQCNNDEVVDEERTLKIRAVQRNDDKAMRSVIEIQDKGMKEPMEVPVQKKMHTYLKRKRRTKALAMLFAHMAGFAAIFSGTSLQRVFYYGNFDKQSDKTIAKLVAWIPMIINQVVLQLAYKISEKVRNRHVEMLRSNLNEKEQEAQRGLKLVEHLMLEEVEESENDVSSLSMSYLAVNVMRFCLTEQMPDEKAEEPEHWSPDLFHHALSLYAIGLLTVVVACGQAFAMNKYKWPQKDKPATLRVLNTILNATGMCSAWCVLWATKWTFQWFCHHNGLKPHKILEKVVLAFVLTSFAACMVFIVDKVDDSLENEEVPQKEEEERSKGEEKEVEEHMYLMPKAGDQGSKELAKEIIRIIVTSLGILVGFSWEHCFDGGVESVTEKTPETTRVYFQLVLGIMVCSLVLPAWRKHILQKVMLMEELMNPEEEEDEPQGGEAPKH